jgi:hypothetical protein
MADILTRAALPPVLSAFLRSQAQQLFQWGVRDCGLIMADWVMASGRPDPAAAIRGKYDSAESCLIICAAPDYQTAITAIADGAGLPRTEDPWDGDIGVVDIPKIGAMGAIMTNGSWAFRTATGITWSKAAPGRLLTAWEVIAHA